MRAVENPDLPLLIGCYIRNHMDIQPGLPEGQLVLKPGGTFNDPHPEAFSHVD